MLYYRPISLLPVGGKNYRPTSLLPVGGKNYRPKSLLPVYGKNIFVHEYYLLISSAYTGGLWLSALKCMIKIAELLSLEESISKFKGVLERGKRSFERKLWNGEDLIFCVIRCVLSRKTFNLCYLIFCVMRCVLSRKTFNFWYLIFCVMRCVLSRKTFNFWYLIFHCNISFLFLLFVAIFNLFDNLCISCQICLNFLPQICFTHLLKSVLLL